MVLPSDIRSRAVSSTRRSLEKVLEVPVFRKAARRAAAEINQALDDPSGSGIYGPEYFGADRDPMDRMGLSGYERYDRESSNANAAAYMVWRNFDVKRTLDVGCAAGFVVEALREMGVEACGTDISHYAIDRATQGARGHVRWGDLMAGVPYGDGEFDLVTCLEVLEHMRPEMIPTVLAELERITSKYVVCTIPSFGPNEWGPGGWFQVKVRDESVQSYYDKGPDYRGPIPHDDIYRDAKGEPIEGHLTLASFAWWTEQFAKVGLTRCGATELRIHPQLARFGLTKYWNLYVFRKVGVDEPQAEVRQPDEFEKWEVAFGLAGRTASPEDAAAVARAIARAEGATVDLGVPQMDGAPHF